MIAHVVLFQPRPDLGGAQRKAVIDALVTATRSAPSVRGCRVGRRVKHGLPGYEQGMATNYEFAVIIEFDDVDGLRAYLQHPAHRAIGEHFSRGAAAALAYDYEMLTADEALSW